MFEGEVLFAILVAVLTGVLEVLKKVGLDPKYVPLSALILGAGSGILFMQGAVAESVLVGLIVGLSSVGLYSGTTNTIDGLKQPPKK